MAALDRPEDRRWHKRIRRLRRLLHAARRRWPKASGRAKDVQIYLAGSLDGLKGQGDNKDKPEAQGNPVLVTTLANVPGTVDIPVAGNGSFLRFRGTNAQDDVAKTLTDVMSVAELGVRVGRSN